MSLFGLADALRAVTDFPSLLTLLKKHLDWPVGDLSFEDAVFEYTPDEAGLSGVPEDQILRVAQLAPLDDIQWGIFFIDFGPAQFRRQLLRAILNRFVERKRGEGLRWPLDQLMFVCWHGNDATTGNTRPTFTFCYFVGESHTRAKLKTFSWTDPRETRTVCEHNLDRLQWAARGSWPRAWDVDRVTKAFFEEFNQIFSESKPKILLYDSPLRAEQLQFATDSTERRTSYLQRIANRLLFIVFLQRKRWLKINGAASQDYLFDLYDQWTANPTEHAGVRDFHDLLTILFFDAFNQPDEQIRKSKEAQIGQAPFLNGGLFHRDEYESSDGPTAVPAADFYDDLLGPRGLLRRYNFTVIENFDETDQDVAIDPEMLGKIFEELVTGRHEKGSYYTPRPIVSFMCREGLKGYLADAGLDAGKVERLVDDHQVSRDDNGVEKDALSPSEIDRTLALLKEVKIVDPACGSGAYLLGMLRELFELSLLLERRRNKATATELYDWKLAIIQENIYGVDIDPVAVNIARLRLWLSLAVDYTGETPRPLPNLDFKIEAGDSLSAPMERDLNSTADMYYDSLVSEFEELKDEYGRPSQTTAEAAHKNNLLGRINESRIQIREYLRHTASAQSEAFDWLVEFAEVFRKPLTAVFTGGGFDIVLANPPYVRMELFKSQKPILRKNFTLIHAERADLYVYFYGRALELLKPGGMLAFISSNKWLRSGYGAKLRAHLSTTCTFSSITDFGDLPVFEGVNAYPVIAIAKKQVSEGTAVYLRVDNLNEPYPDISALISMFGRQLSGGALDGKDWKFTTSSAIRAGLSTTSLGDYVDGQIYGGVVTGLNQAFYIDGETRQRIVAESPVARTFIKKLTLGGSIRRWVINDTDDWLLYIEHGAQIAGIESVLDHLSPHREQLENRATAQQWYELRQPQSRFAARFSEPKIVYPDIALEPRFCIDYSGTYIGNSACCILSGDLFLLGVLNSSSVARMFADMAAQIRGGYLRFIRQYVERIPIPNAAETDRSEIASLVQNCLDVKGVNCQDWERQINERVEYLYSRVTADETYDQWTARMAAEAVTAVGEVRELIAAGEKSKVEFKQSLEYVDPQSPEILRIPAGDVRTKRLAEIRKAVTHSALKSICAFLNASGGTLLVGVHDSLGPVGIEPDFELISKPKDQNPDGWERKFRDLLDSRLNMRPVGLLEFSFPKIDGKIVACIDVQPSAAPFYLDNQYFVRDGNRTIILEAHERDAWIQQQRSREG